jgi:exosortase
MAGPVISCADVIAAEPQAGDRKAWPTLAVLGAVWVFALNQLHVEWTINPQYTYGWTVPFLALYLFAERWKDRPRSEPFRFAPFVGIILILVALALLPLRIVAEAAPDWRLLNWAMALSAVLISFCALDYAGGRSWMRHFALPILFVLLAVPWPVPIERSLVQELMRFVAGVCVEALSFFAIPAGQDGNVIIISTGKVGVEEACSGVRSLQTTLMASLFLGELFRFGFIRRSVLLIGGLTVAFLCNLGRSFALVWISVQESPASAAKWHDSIGHTVLVVSLVLLALLCFLLRPRPGTTAAVEISDAPPWRPRFAPRSILIAGACWLIAMEGGTELWYRLHERGGSVTPWSVQWPVGEPGFREIPLGETTRTILRFDEGKSVAWQQEGGPQWFMNFLRWFPGRASKQLARSHGPEVCLAATGAVLRQDYGVQPMRVAGIDLPMHRYLFSVRETPMFVFYCLWEDFAAADGPRSTQRDMTMSSRMRDALEGRRNTGQQVIEVAVIGPRSPEEATAATTKMLADLIKP